MQQSGRAWPLFLAIVLGLTAAWWYFAPDTLPTALRQVAAPSPAPEKPPPALYKWRDAAGQLHVTDVKPTGRPYETVRYNPDTNVMPAYHKPGEAPPDNQ